MVDLLNPSSTIYSSVTLEKVTEVTESYFGEVTEFLWSYFCLCHEDYRTK
jgi:hypothetical protein